MEQEPLHIHIHAVCFLKDNRRSTRDVIPNAWPKGHLHENPVEYFFKKETSGPPQSPCVRIPVSLSVVLQIGFSWADHVSL